MTDLTQGSVARHVLHQTVPMVFGIGAIISVGLVDAYFLGQMGSAELAAISFIFPVTVALSSLGVGVMVGINSAMSRALGGKRRDYAIYLGLVGLELALGLGLLIAVLLWAFMDPLFVLMNADSQTLPLINQYMTPYALGFPTMLVAQGLNGGLRAQGAAVRSAAVLWTIAIANWVLDPLLIMGFGPVPAFGVAGAAYASVGSFLLASIVGFVLVQGSDLPLRWVQQAPVRWKSAAGSIFAVGGPAALSSAINPIGLSVLTAFLAGYGTDVVAGFGAAGRIQMLAVVPLLALSSSIGSIVGQNWGARSFSRAARALSYSGAFSTVYGFTVAGVLVLARRNLGQAFTDDPAVLEAIDRYLLIAAWGYAGYGVLIVVNGALNAVGRAGVSLAISAARVGLVMIPVAYLGSTLAGDDGVHWIYIGELLANLIGGAAAASVAYSVVKRSKRSAASRPASL